MPRNKQHLSHKAVATKANKDLFIKALAAGNSPAKAAEAIGSARSTAYDWKKEDPAFDAEWRNAVETALDKLEDVVFEGALNGDTECCRWLLKWRRRDVYNDTEESRLTSQTNYIANITVQEHIQRLERLGLPVPVIETDYEDETAPENSSRSQVASR
jgi:hypothetical protein